MYSVVSVNSVKENLHLLSSATGKGDVPSKTKKLALDLFPKDVESENAHSGSIATLDTHHWSVREEALLVHHANNREDIAEIARLLKRELEDTKKKWKELQILFPKMGDPSWDVTEEAILVRDAKNQKDVPEIASLLERAPKDILKKWKELQILFPEMGDPILPKKFKWTPALEEKLMKCSSRGLNEIAKTLGCDKKEIVPKLRELKEKQRGVQRKYQRIPSDLPGKSAHWPPEKAKELKEGCESGYSISELALKFGKTYEAIRCKLNRLGVRISKKAGAWNTEEDELVVKYVKEGQLTYTAIAKKLQTRSRSAVCTRWLHHLQPANPGVKYAFSISS